MAGAEANYGPREVFGPFFRRASDTQDAVALRKQVFSGEIWGLIPRWGARPAVKAIPGPMPENQCGVEFWAFQEPDRPVGPRSHWTIEGPYVTIDASDEIAKLKVAFARISQNLAAE